ncbi:MAG: TonB-dependent receptor [Salinibacter sp.]
MRFWYYGPLCFLLVLSSPAVGQTPDSTSTDSFRVQLPEVTVEAARATETVASAPFSVSIAERSSEDVSLTPNTSLDDVLRPFAGVWVNDRHHFALGERISVRGVGYRSNFGVRGLQVLYDGIPLTLPDGQAFLDVVDPAVVRRVELVRSPSSLFWGNGSGGVLFLSSGGPSDVPALRARVQGGSYGQWQGLLEGSASVGDWTVQSYASGIRQDGYREHSQGYRLRGGLNAARSFGSSTQVRLVAAADAQDTKNPSSLTLDQFRSDPSQARPLFAENNAGKTSEQGQLGISVEHQLDGATLSGSGHYVYRSLENPLPFGYVTYDRHSGGGRATLRRTTGRLEGGLGLDAGVQFDDRIEYTATSDGTRGDEVTLDQLETVLNGAAFGYFRFNATDRLALTAGLRLERMQFEADDRLLSDGDQSGRRTFSALSPSVGASYTVGSAQIFAQYSTAFETPTAAELSNRPDGSGGFNQQVEPQRTRGYEVGTRGTVPSARLEYDVTVYRLQVDDLISSFETSDARTVYDNLGANVHDGIEASLTWQAAEGLEVAARYTGNRFVIRESDSDPSLVENRVPGIPPRRLYLHTELEQQDWWMRLSGEGIPSYYVNDENTAQTPRYLLANVRLGHRGTQWGSALVKPFVAVDNVLDEPYVSSVVINAGDAYYEPGPARSISLGVNVEW